MNKVKFGNTLFLFFSKKNLRLFIELLSKTLNSSMNPIIVENEFTKANKIIAIKSKKYGSQESQIKYYEFGWVTKIRIYWKSKSFLFIKLQAC